MGLRPAEHDLTPIEELEFTARTFICLKREEVDTVGQLVAMSEEELLDIRNLGMTSIEEIRSKLAGYGYE